MAAAAAFCAGAFADACKCGREDCNCGESCECAEGVCKCSPQESSSGGWEYTPGEGISFDENPVLAFEAGLSFDSKYMTYGVVDGKDPILTPSATITLADWVYFGVESIFDVTKGNGKRAGYGNRAGKYTTLDTSVGLAHEFDLGETLGALSVDFNYIYEYIRRYHSDMGDTQYLNLELSLGDLLLEPKLWIERDLMADDGTYVNFEIGHTFALNGKDAEIPVTFKPSVAQGFGNSLRTKGYFDETSGGFDHGGIMDTSVKGEFEIELSENFKLGAYLAYYDYIFDSNMRDAARDYNSAWGKGEDHSWNFVGGVSATYTF